MQKQRIVDMDHVAGIENNPVIAFAAPRARFTPRLAGEADVAVLGPARRLQNDLARAFAAKSGWSVKRTVIVGIVFHAVVLGALGLAASNLVPHLIR